tara:strand:- start:280 stop:945 length:666 start_codon:yes stop_codon:yes gene_type:complete
MSHKVLRRAQKDASSFSLSGFNVAWRRLEHHPALHSLMWPWLEDNYGKLPACRKTSVHARIRHILHQLSTTVQNGKLLKVDLHHVNKEAAVATMWHFVASAAPNAVLEFITGKGTHSAHGMSVLRQHLQCVLTAAKCDFKVTRISVRVECTSKTQQQLHTYLLQCATASVQLQEKHSSYIMPPSKQHRPGHFKYDGQQRVLQDRLKKRERRLKAVYLRNKF